LRFYTGKAGVLDVLQIALLDKSTKFKNVGSAGGAPGGGGFPGGAEGFPGGGGAPGGFPGGASEEGPSVEEVD